MTILERAELPVIAHLTAEFEEAFARVRHLPAQIEGFQRLTLHRGIESPDLYVLLIEWASVEAHEVGFRTSPQYLEWSETLHRFYDPFPTVEHFELVG